MAAALQSELNCIIPGHRFNANSITELRWVVPRLVSVERLVSMREPVQLHRAKGTIAHGSEYKGVEIGTARRSEGNAELRGTIGVTVSDRTFFSLV